MSIYSYSLSRFPSTRFIFFQKHQSQILLWCQTEMHGMVWDKDREWNGIVGRWKIEFLSEHKLQMSVFDEVYWF